jgi:hypothetical protein
VYIILQKLNSVSGIVCCLKDSLCILLNNLLGSGVFAYLLTIRLYMLLTFDCAQSIEKEKIHLKRHDELDDELMALTQLQAPIS